jgi:hypothetical protein
MALGAPWIATNDPIATSWSQLRKAPSWAHPFGTDDLGRDVFSRVLAGSRDILLVAPLATVLATVLGTALGLLTGSSRRAEILLDSTVQMVRNVPTLALIPLVILWFGIGLMPKVMLTAVIVFFLTFKSTFTGVRSVDRELVDVLDQLQGVWLPIEVWERDVLPARVAGYSTAQLDAASASGEFVWLARRSTEAAEADEVRIETIERRIKAARAAALEAGAEDAGEGVFQQAEAEEKRGRAAAARHDRSTALAGLERAESLYGEATGRARADVDRRVVEAYLGQAYVP